MIVFALSVAKDFVYYFALIRFFWWQRLELGNIHHQLIRWLSGSLLFMSSLLISKQSFIRKMKSDALIW